MNTKTACEQISTYEVLEHIMGIKGLHPHRLSTIDAMRQKLADHVVSCPELSQGTILDIGCGTGQGTRDMALRLGGKVRVIGIDINEFAIEEARIEHIDIGNLSFFHGDLKSFQIAYTESKIAGVISVSMSMFVPEIHEFYKEVHDALIPGGIFIDAPFTFRESHNEVTDELKLRTYSMCGCNMRMFMGSQLKSALQTTGFYSIDHVTHDFDLMNLPILFKDYPLRYLLGNFVKNVAKPPAHFGSASSSYLAKRTMSIFGFFLRNKKMYAGGELVAIKTRDAS
jgi:SAM-dependent methyltransferase